ncbi:DUF1294 domain-containing protein [Candidatus Uhrbacteria bacterium]|jgi:uncharacterized membrane protein YsdA (DUF1294 family)|nr:DUF1294 domain-containing protein [Candidatus Uhrbacteria bacterium]
MLSPYDKRAAFIWIVLVITSTFASMRFFNLDLVINVLIATNIATFLLMGFDKIQSSSRGGRIPERMFYAMTFFGGSVGMLAGMYSFRHKTQKGSFQFFVALMIMLQVGLILWTFSPEGLF